MQMSNPEPLDAHERARRKMLLASTAGMGAVGVAATAIPFIETMAPSERARAEGAPTEVDVARIVPGAIVTVAWRGLPVFVLHRTPTMLAGLGKHDELLRDPHSQEDQQPEYARNRYRSIVPAILVVDAVCTHLGCTPVFRPEAGPDLGPPWPGGFYCPCHGSKYDLSGRVFVNVPAPLNLVVPPYAFHGPGKLVIGEPGPGSLA